MEKDTKGFWNLVVGPVEPGLYSYAFQIDKVQFADLRNHLLKPYRGAHESLLEVSGARPQVWQQQPVPHGKARPSEAKLDNTEAYGTLNMGAGFAFFVSADDAEKTAVIARECGIDAWVSGAVETGPKQVIIEPIGVTYRAHDLKLR